MVAGGAKSSLCAFADWFPGLVGSELEQARALGHQSRETSWTDRMLLELKKLRDPRIFVQASKESMTGADMDWHFVREDGQRHIHLAVQAKILHYTRPRTPDRYDDLAYPNRSGKQSRQLTSFARRQMQQGYATYPLYLFYNPASANAWPIFCSPGVTLASGYRIAHHLTEARKLNVESKVSSQAIELETIEALMFCLHDIFCCDADDIPDPDDVVAALATIDAEKDEITHEGPRLPRPSAGERTPQDIEHIVGLMRDGSAENLGAELEEMKTPARPRIVFLSRKERR